VGHVLGSVVLGFLGIFVGIAVFKLETIESMRGDIAAWMLLIFGFTYVVWGAMQLRKSKYHKHKHIHADGTIHKHDHNHTSSHAHAHETPHKKVSFWMLFIIFVLGPCEALIPLIMYPASQGNMVVVFAAVVVFACATLATMLTLVIILLYGTSRFRFPNLERYAHVIAGFAIFFCGFGMIFLNW